MTHDADPTHYEVLGVPADASGEEIRRAFRDAAKVAHPDAGGDQARFRRLRRAYETLSSPRRRRDYDDALGIRRTNPAEGGSVRAGWTGQRGEFTGDVQFPSWLRDVVERPWSAASDPGGEASPPPGRDAPGAGSPAGWGPPHAADARWWWPRHATLPPVTDGGLLLLVQGRSVVAVDASSGYEAWEADLGVTATAAPLVVGDLVVVGTGDGTVHALERGRGVTSWERSTGADPVVATTAVRVRGRGGDVPAVVAAAGRRLSSIDPATGRARWAARPAGPLRAVVRAGEVVVCVTAARTLEAFDAARGRQRWRHRVTVQPEIAGCVTGAGLWLAGPAGRLLCLDPPSGGVRHQLDVGRAVAGLRAAGSELLVTVAGPPRLLCLDTAATPRWSLDLPVVCAEPAVVGDRVVLLGTDARLRAADLATGAPRGVFTLPFEPVGAPVAGADGLYVRDRGGPVWSLAALP